MNINKNFNTYISRKIPNYQNMLTKDEIDYLESLYNDYIDWLNIQNATIARSVKTGMIDYENDINKNQDRTEHAEALLDQEFEKVITRLKQEGKLMAPTL